MMLRLVMLAVLAFAASAMVSVDEFRNEIKHFKTNVKSFARNIRQVEQLARMVIKDPTHTDHFHEEFGALGEYHEALWMEETERLFQLFFNVWDDPVDFEESYLCEMVSVVADHASYNDSLPVAQLEYEFAEALAEDLGCFRKLFLAVKDIDTSKMISGFYPEEDAMALLASIMQHTHRMKMSLRRFGAGLNTIYDIIYGSDSGEVSSTVTPYPYFPSTSTSNYWYMYEDKKKRNMNMDDFINFAKQFTKKTKNRMKQNNNWP